MKTAASDGLSFVRFILVWSSLSPVFLLWAVRGTKAVDETNFTAVCLVLFLAPTLLLWAFWSRSRARNTVRTVKVIKAEDPKDHILTYLFAMLIPLFQSNIDDKRQLAVAILAICMIMFLFWHMRLHYMNFVFALLGYNIFTVKVDAGLWADGPSHPGTWVVISRRTAISDGEMLTGYRLGGLVLADKAE